MTVNCRDLTGEPTMNHLKQIREDAKEFAKQLDRNLPPERVGQLIQERIKALNAEQTATGLIRLWREFVVRELRRVA